MTMSIISVAYEFMILFIDMVCHGVLCHASRTCYLRGTHCWTTDDSVPNNYAHMCIKWNTIESLWHFYHVTFNYYDSLGDGLLWLLSKNDNNKSRHKISRRSAWSSKYFVASSKTCLSRIYNNRLGPSRCILCLYAPPIDKPLRLTSTSASFGMHPFSLHIDNHSSYCVSNQWANFPKGMVPFHAKVFGIERIFTVRNKGTVQWI